MKEEIKTFEEFKEHVGKKVNCVYTPTNLQLENAEIYHCTNNEHYYLIHKDLDGGKPSSKEGEGAWMVDAEEIGDNITNIVLVADKNTARIEQSKYYYKDSPKKPTWFDGRPVLCYYSNESEEDAIDKGNVGWLVTVATEECSYLYRVFADYDIIETYLENEVDIDSCGDYAYVMPVIRENEELKALKKQRDEIDAKIALMESK